MLEAGRAQHRLGGFLHGRRRIMSGELRRVAVERRVRLEGELVRRKVRRVPADALFDVGLRLVRRLAGQPIHEVEVEVVEARLGNLDCVARFVRAVDAAKRPEVRVVEALDADRQPVDAAGSIVAELLRLERARVRLERDLGIGRERQARAEFGKQAIDRARREEARRAAAEEDAVHAPAPDPRQRVLEVRDKRGAVRVLGQVAFLFVRVEIAVRAFAHAPRHVHIERERRQRFEPDQARPGERDAGRRGH